ncbi:Dynein light chain [Malassezia obtusa]|uniref:Dynein light chain n=1 Tax=Malassezia obtusa TaxID=76774 RepID=A0AAF0E141_9BASI|nr:Dynein light chain [Malassezia obtusa]
MADAAPGAVGASDVPKAVVKNVDMEADMQQAIVEIAADAIVKFELEKDIAAFVKRTVDDHYGPTWHVIVGRSFGSYVTHESKHFIYFCASHG